jgi:hypothetical protein
LSSTEDWRTPVEWLIKTQRVEQFLAEHTEEGEGFHIRYITLKHHYFSWCRLRGLASTEYSWNELLRVLIEKSLMHFEQSTLVTGIQMKHPVGLPRYYNGKRKGLSNSVKEAVYAKLHRNGNTCALCGRPIILPNDKVHIDHIIPVRQGGSDDLSNLQVVHDACNLAKG